MNARLRRGGPLLRAALASAVGIALGAGALVWTRTEITSLRYRLAQLVRNEAAVRHEVEKLRVESAALSAPERIEPEARALGLRYPHAGQVLHLPAVASGGTQ